ncbi:unnamed protein product [Tilletia controversa]|nr:hypothetical protein CF328_g2605 [Tilletia controversa]CAD6977834.1 unnamed protein product [Tilletia controversa]
MTSFSTYASRFLSSAYGPFRTEDEEQHEHLQNASEASPPQPGTAPSGSRFVATSAAPTAQARPTARQHTAAPSKRPANFDADPLFYSALYGYDPLHQHNHTAAAAAAHAPYQHPFGGDPFGDPYEGDEDHHSHSNSDDEHDPSDSRNLHSVALPRDSQWAAAGGGSPRSSILNPTPHSSDSGSASGDDDDGDGRRRFARRNRRKVYRDDDDGDGEDQEGGEDGDEEDEYYNSEEEEDMLNQQRRRHQRPSSADASSSSSENEDDTNDAHDETLSLSGRVIYVHPEHVDNDGWGPWFTRMARGKYNDKSAAVVFASATTFTLLVAGGVAFGAKPQSAPESPSTRPSSYYTITRTLPILILLTLLSIIASLANLWILRHVAQRLGGGSAALGPAGRGGEEDGAAKVWVRNALLAIPAVLGLGWVWALAGSFVYDDEQWTGGGWSTTGLRLFSLIPLLMAFLFARSVYKRRAALSRSIAVLELSCSILLAHPYIFLVALAQLGIFILLTIPFLTIFARLFLVGHFSSAGGGGKEEGAKVWITSSRAAWLAWITFGTWLWTWAVLRGIQRVTIAGVVSHWYFHRTGPEGASPHAPPALSRTTPANVGVPPAPASQAGLSSAAAAAAAAAAENVAGPSPIPAPGAWLAEEDQPNSPNAKKRTSGSGAGPIPPSPEDVVRASLSRATGPSFGTIILAALVLSLLRLATIVAWCARRVSKAIARSASQRLVSAAGAGVGVGPIALGLDNVASRGLSIWMQPVGHGAAVLAGLTAVAQSVSEYALVYTGVTGEGFWKGARRAGRLVGRHGVKGVMDGLVINLLLDMTTIALSFLAGVAGFLFSAHQLHVPADAPLVGLLCAAVPYWTLRLCADVLRNAADTVYLCWAIDRQLQDEHCTKADEAFQMEEDGTLPF